ncbi:MAG: filamentous hemagglutinin family protein [Zhongshania aliphaticivorans]|jgi:filamentous hemagglutinin family protein
MVIRNFSCIFWLLPKFIKHSDISEDTNNRRAVTKDIKVGQKLLVNLVFVSLCFLPLTLAQAQIQTDGSLGSAQSLSGPDYVINEDLGQRAGNNLFHSFSEFNIHTGESATFTGAHEITNVISRVTGGNLSTINGLLRSEIANANFYLINSSGILFGQNASLSINGSFHASTADFIRLGDADLFYSEPLQGEILSTAAPTAFGFFGAPQGGITVAGSQLELEAGATFSLVGGEVTVKDGASIHIPQGQINLVGVNSSGEAIFDTTGGYQDLDASAFAQLNDVTILNRSELNVNGDGGGRVVIRGGQMVLEESVVSAQTTGGQPGGGIDIAADHLNFVHSRIDTKTTGSGNAGDVLIDANTLVLDGLGALGEVGIFANAADFGDPSVELNSATAGKAGTITITATQVDVLGEVRIETTAALSADTGTIDLSTSTLRLNGFDAELQVNSGRGELIRLAGGNIILDGSFNPAMDGVALAGPNYSITADLGQTAGNNLFHSFRDFLVDEGETATFSGPETVANIITRVTGNNITSIYGQLSSDIPGANLYLINPNGLFFGANATLNLPGSFHIGTADYLTLADGGRFDASVPAESMLDASDLSAYGFMDDEIGGISIENTKLGLSENETFSLIGGNLWLRNVILDVPSGQINLVGLQSAGEVSILEGSNDFDVSGFSEMGSVSVTNALLSVSSQNENPAGRIFARSDDLSLDNNGNFRSHNRFGGASGSIDVLLSGDLFIGRDSRISIVSEGTLGQISVEAENIDIIGTGSEVRIGIDALQRGEGDGVTEDKINLKVTVAQTLNIIDGAINTTTDGGGNGGNALVQARNLTISGQEAGILAQSDGPGNSGELNVIVEELLEIINGGAITASAFGAGNSGKVTVQSKNLTINGRAAGIFAQSFGLGNGGELDVTVAELLEIIDGGVIDTSAFRTGNGGKVTVVAKDLIIDGQGSSFLTGISSLAAPDSTGNGGELAITVEEQLEIIGGGLITSATFAAGNAGAATVQAKNLTIDNQGSDFLGGIITLAGIDSTGTGGNLDIIITELLEIIEGGIIDVSTFAAGNAGAATIQAKNLTIDGQNSEFLAGIGSAAAFGSTGNGGDLNITVTEQVEIIDGGVISASAETSNAGNLRISAGGNIRIANSFLSISAGQADFDVNDLSNFIQPELFIESGDSISIQDSLLSTSAGALGGERGAGGDIYLIAPIEIRLENSTLSAQAGHTGGNVYIDSIRYIVISSDVIAQADIQGGNYSVTVRQPSGWIQSTDSQINLSGEQSGAVLSNTSPFDLGAELSDLELNFLNVEDWALQRCKLRLGGIGSSFVVTGWRGVSNNSDDFLPSEPILLADYNFPEMEPIRDEFLEEAMFPELDDGCEDCP